MKKDNYEIGRLGEQRAERYLIKNGYEILCKNFRIRGGEIDIIAKKKNIIAFVEVKTRKTDSLVKPVEAVDKAKIKRITETAAKYMIENGIKLQPRFDICEAALYPNGDIRVTNYIKNAFISEDEYALF